MIKDEREKEKERLQNLKLAWITEAVDIILIAWFTFTGSVSFTACLVTARRTCLFTIRTKSPIRTFCKGKYKTNMVKMFKKSTKTKYKQFLIF